MREPTQFGRLLDELDITSIPARSPQAKGRVERLFGTLQDRLVSVLRLAGATNEAEATACLADFCADFNDRFMVPAAEDGACYRTMEEGTNLDTLFCFKYQRTVGMDNTVRFGGNRLQLLPGPRRSSWARAVVEVQERLDGSLVVAYHGQSLATTPAPLEARCCAHAADAGERSAGGGARAGDVAPTVASGAGHPARGRRETGSVASVETRLPTASGQNR